MADGTGEALDIAMVGAMSEIGRGEWDAIANPPHRPFDPFMSWDFLEATESTHCADRKHGWTPAHLLARDAKGVLRGAIPMYAKAHSRGEYVFDHGWADAFHRAGGDYYPKLLAAAPFTPATGRRVLTEDPALETALVDAAITLTKRAGASSFNLNFVPDDQADRLQAHGLLRRTGLQYHWSNDGYTSFDHFLGALSSQKRKNIRKERQRAQDGLVIRRLTGDDIKPADWDFFFRCYMDTGSRKWGTPYFNREFFHLIGARMPEKIVLFIADRDGRPIASALNFLGGDTLYGRYWGCVAQVDFLHFELCYYQAIDVGIELGLKRVEAGAQGHHKLARGYAPTATNSLHWIAHPGLRDAIARFLEHETPAMNEEIEALEEHTPFKKSES